jgi:hypothetical protein
MVSLVLTIMLSTSEIVALPPEKPKTEARKRGGKGQRGRRRGGGGLR